MKKIKINKERIFLMLILIMLVILIGYTKTDAFEYANINNIIKYGNVGDTVKIGYGTLTSENNLYCVQHGATLKNKQKLYTVLYKVEINGNVATSTDINGNKKTTVCNENGFLAYILGGGNYANGYGTKGNNTSRQKELWHYWGNWIEASGKNLGINWNWQKNSSVEAISNLENEATAYSKNSGTAQISSNVGQSIDTDNQKAGAFNVTYTGQISSVIVKDSEEQDITSNVSFIQNNNTINAKDIASGTDFYIINNTEKILKDVTINVSGNNEVIKLNAWFLENSTSGWQRVMAVQPEKITGGGTASVKIEITTCNTLRVVKYGVSNKGSEEKQTGVKFIVFKTETGYLCTDTVEYPTGKMTYNSKDFYWTKERDKATIFETGNTADKWNGYFQITELPSGTYYIGEIFNPNKGYEDSKICTCNLEIWSGNKNIKTATLENIQENNNINGYSNKMQVVSTKLENGYTNILRIYDSNVKTNLTIKKKSTTGKTLKAGFIVYSKEEKAFLSEESDSGYTQNIKKATVYYTTSGTKVISGLEYGTYYIFETEAPKGYKLSNQDGYKEKPSGVDIEMSSLQEWIYSGKVTLSEKKSDKTVTYINELREEDNDDKNNNISGYVWIDEPQSKNSNYNNKYDNGEKRVSGITVKLYNKNGTLKSTTVTNSEGEYSFNNIEGKISDFYVEFNYLNTEYSSCAVAVPDYSASNGSKVTSTDTSGIATTYTGTNETNEAKYGLTASYNENTATVDNINMGLIEIPDSGYAITETIAYVDMTMNGYTYRYTYGGSGKAIATVPTVNWQERQAYTRDIYPSDIIYNIENQTEALKINVVYRIDVTNTTTTYIEYVYMEKSLQITDLTNTYDHDRYSLNDNNWTETSGKAKINSDYLASVNNGGLRPNETATAYISFKVNEKAIEEVLTNPDGVAENKNNPTKVTANAYHKYERKEDRVDDDGNTYTVIIQCRTGDKELNAVSHYLIFKLPENARTLSGTMFEDLDEKDAEVLGNGKYDNNTEGTVSNVKVELLLKNGSGEYEVSKLYKNNADGTTIYENGELPKAITTTDDKGRYSFAGVVPGEYYVRFTYGDGTQKIKQLDGTEKPVYSNQYKSTIITLDTIKNAIETTYEPTKALWYLDIEDKVYSTAVDNFEQRLNITKIDIDYSEVNTNYKEANTAPTIYAETSQISIPIEYTRETEGIGTIIYPYEYDGINFGIINIPEISLEINKEITNVKLLLSNGQALFNGNPLSKMDYVASLDGDSNKAGGSGYVRVEANSDYIYGSTLVVTYGIKVTNNSDLVYVEDNTDSKYGWYYKYGDSQYGHEATINITDVLDYLDPMLTKIASDDNKLEEIKVSELDESNSFYRALKYLNLTDETEYEKIFNFKGFGSLTTSKGNDVANSSKILSLTASKLLSTEDEDLEFINNAQIVKLTIDKLTYKDPSPIDNDDSIEKLSMIQDTAKITITPPTGKNKSQINYIFVIIELVVLSTGIIVIKKKFLK